MTNKSYTIALSLINKKVGRWTVLGVTENRSGNWLVLCECDCGTTRNVMASRLAAGNSKSCGCLSTENKITHGHTQSHRRAKSREYWIWNSMKNRCINPNYKHYKDYGGRGISLCQSWHVFENFFSDMGVKPDGMTLERIDNSKGYSPENCRWESRHSQSRNKRSNRWITADGVSMVITDWAARIGLCHSTIIARIDRGWPDHLAVTTPKYIALKRALKIN